uniref:Uncharacterized protein n=1 Tax=Setaria viridis TaxID=4556 RepID=A0A4U6TAD3_SETVI|nr:hypothetical protein SEVIR_9G485125v2 [Setaria viridis]
MHHPSITLSLAALPTLPVSSASSQSPPAPGDAPGTARSDFSASAIWHATAAANCAIHHPETENKYNFLVNNHILAWKAFPLREENIYS